MRTTLRIDDDVLLAVQERARREKRSASAVLSELARSGLAGQAPPNDSQPVGGRDHHGFRPLPHRGRPVSNALIDLLREEDRE